MRIKELLDFEFSTVMDFSSHNRARKNAQELISFPQYHAVQGKSWKKLTYNIPQGNLTSIRKTTVQIGIIQGK